MIFPGLPCDDIYSDLCPFLPWGVATIIIFYCSSTIIGNLCVLPQAFAFWKLDMESLMRAMVCVHAVNKL